MKQLEINRLSTGEIMNRLRDGHRSLDEMLLLIAKKQGIKHTTYEEMRAKRIERLKNEGIENES